MASRSNGWFSFLRRRANSSRNHDTSTTPIALEEVKLETDGTEKMSSPLELTREGKLEELKTLAMKTQNQCLRATDDKGKSLLHLASESGATHIMQYLIDSGAVHLNAQDKDGNTALHLAVESRQVGAVDLLLKLGASDTLKNHAENPPLHIALRKPDSGDLVSTFTKHPINLIVRGYHDHTSLHVIAEHDNLEALEILHNVAVARNQDLEKQALQVHSLDKHGMTPIHLAARKGSHRVLSFIISEIVRHGVLNPREVLEYLNEEDKTPLQYAVESGHLKVVEVLLKYGASPVATRGNHLPPIHLACSQNRLGMVKAIVEKFGPDILKCRDHEGHTPLHSSVSSVDTTDMFSYLLEQGAELDALDENCHTPLHDAVIDGNAIAVDYLLDRGSNPLVKSKLHHHNCLHSAVLYKRKEVFKKLMNCPQASVMKNEPDSEGNFPVHLALNVGLDDVVVRLLSCANVSVKDRAGNNYLHLAALAGDCKSLLSVLAMECSSTMLNELNVKGQSPLHSSALSGSLPIIKELVDRGAVVQKCHDGQTPFTYACSLGQFEAAKALYQAHPFQRDWVDNEGNTALHLAVVGGEPDTMSFCLDTGMVITLNNTGLSFLDMLLKKADEELAYVTIKHDRWQECLDVTCPDTQHPVIRMIARIPKAFLHVLDRCVDRSSLDSHHPNYWEEYNFKYLVLDPEDCNVQSPEGQGRKEHLLDGNIQEGQNPHPHLSEESKDQQTIQLHMENPLIPEVVHVEQKPILTLDSNRPPTQPQLSDQKRNNAQPLQVVKRMVKYKQKPCLIHPVVVTYLNLKWTDYAQWIYMFRFLMLTLFTVFLSTFIWITPPPLQSTNPSENITEIEISLNSNAIRFTTLFLAILNTIVWTVEFYALGRLVFAHFIKEFHFWSTGISLLCTFIFLIPWRGLDTVLWEAGVFAAFFAWIGLLFGIQLFDVAGIYVTMLTSTTKNVFRVLLIVFLFVCAFAFPIHILVGSVERLQYPTVELSIFSVFHTLITAVDYPNIVALENLSELRFSVLVFIFFIALLIMMPIVVINLLIGLAVGDIANIQQQAIISRRTLEVDSLSKLDKLLPKPILNKFTRKRYKVFPNKARGNLINRLWQRLVHAMGEESHGTEGETDHQRFEHSNDKGTERQLNLLQEKVEQLTLDQSRQIEALRHVNEQMESVKCMEEALNKLVELHAQGQSGSV